MTKLYSVALFFFLISSLGQAAVVDHFKCNVSGWDPAGVTLFGSLSDFYSIRKDSVDASGPSRSITSSSISIKTHGAFGNEGDVFIQYQFAVKRDSFGHPLQAKEYFCEETDTVIGIENPWQGSGCLVQGEDPWGSDAKNWDDVAIANGMPVFDAQKLHSSTMTFADKSKVIIDCNFVDTEQ